VAGPHADDRAQSVEPAPESMTLLVAAVIVHDRERGRVVLVQRGERARFGRGLWDLPTGKSEPGEPVTTTAVRELREETGLSTSPESLRVVHVVHGARGAQAPHGFLTVVFATCEWRGRPENREPDKHAQVRWADVTALPREFVPSTANALHGYLTGGPGISVHGWG